MSDGASGIAFIQVKPALKKRQPIAIRGTERLGIDGPDRLSGVAGVSRTKRRICRFKLPVIRVLAASGQSLIARQSPLKIAGLDECRGLGIRARRRIGGELRKTRLAPGESQSKTAQQDTTAK